MHPHVNHSIGMFAGLGILLGQVVADPTVLDPSTIAQITALAAAVGTACFGAAAVVRAVTDAYVKVRDKPPTVQPEKTSA